MKRQRSYRDIGDWLNCFIARSLEIEADEQSPMETFFCGVRMRSTMRASLMGQVTRQTVS